MPRKSSRFFVAAWIVFAVSFFLPAFDDMVGWLCAGICASLINKLNEWASIYYFAFTIPNLLMLLSPLIVSWLNKKPRKMKWLNGVALFCALYVLSFGVINWVSPGSELKTGYYLWLISFWLLFLGFVISKRGILPNTAPSQTQEATA